jgi:hypothetical protein
VRDNPTQALEAKISYLEELGERILDSHHRGWSVSAIARAECGGLMPLELITMGHFSRRALVLSYLQPNRKQEA